jgi:hypothetical protein
MAAMRRWWRGRITKLSERRAARKARKLETAHRRAEEGWDEPPINMGSGM